MRSVESIEELHHLRSAGKIKDFRAAPTPEKEKPDPMMEMVSAFKGATEASMKIANANMQAIIALAAGLAGRQNPPSTEMREVKEEPKPVVARENAPEKSVIVPKPVVPIAVVKAAPKIALKQPLVVIRHKHVDFEIERDTDGFAQKIVGMGRTFDIQRNNDGFIKKVVCGKQILTVHRDGEGFVKQVVGEV